MLTNYCFLSGSKEKNGSFCFTLPSLPVSFNDEDKLDTFIKSFFVIFCLRSFPSWSKLSVNLFGLNRSSRVKFKIAFLGLIESELF